MADAVNRSSRRMLLEWVSLVYLFLPCLLFGAGFLRWWAAIPFCALVVVGCLLTLRELRGPGRNDGAVEWARESDTSATRWKFVALFGIVGFLVAYSGMSAWSAQVVDYEKHDIFLKEFIEYPWPVAYLETGPGGVPGVISYYMYYYLPAAAFGKLFGWYAANQFTIVWGFLGVWLSLCWFFRLIGGVSVWCGLFFLFFGGLDILGWLILRGGSIEATTRLDFWLLISSWDMESLKGMWVLYTSNLFLLYWSPHQVLATWVLTGIVMYHGARGALAKSGLFIWSVSILSSTFAALGLIPLVALAGYQAIGAPRPSLRAGVQLVRNSLGVANVVVAPVVIGVSVLFLQSNVRAYPKGFLWKFTDLASNWWALLLFYAVEFGLYAVCYACTPKAFRRRYALWWWACIVSLVLIPWYRLGIANDFSARTSMPALFVLAVCLVGSWRAAYRSRAWFSAVAMGGLLVLGSLASVGELIISVRGAPLKIGNANAYEDIEHLNQHEAKAIILHYFGRPDAFFFRTIGKPPILQENVSVKTEAREP